MKSQENTSTEKREITVETIDKFLQFLHENGQPVIHKGRLRTDREDMLIKEFLDQNGFSDQFGQFVKKYETFYSALWQTRQYKNALADKLKQFQRSYNQLCFVLTKDASFGVDAKAYLSDTYPFPVLIEDLMVNEWVEKCIENLEGK